MKDLKEYSSSELRYELMNRMKKVETGYTSEDLDEIKKRTILHINDVVGVDPRCRLVHNR